MTISDKELFEHARQVQAHAYAPYSRFHVGAAIVDEKGDVHTGCNVENASYPIGACAEAIAIGAMVKAGRRRIVKIAVVGGEGGQRCTPCGGCRQRIAEFSDAKTVVLTEDGPGKTRSFLIGELLPASFGPADLPD